VLQQCNMLHAMGCCLQATLLRGRFLMLLLDFVVLNCAGPAVPAGWHPSLRFTRAASCQLSY
jgi:hypothetical protein